MVPQNGYAGDVLVDVTVTDNGEPGLKATFDFPVTVKQLSEPPLLTTIGNQNTDENTPFLLSVVFSDEDIYDTHTITISTDEEVLTVEGDGHQSGSAYLLIPAAIALGRLP